MPSFRQTSSQQFIEFWCCPVSNQTPILHSTPSHYNFKCKNFTSIESVSWNRFSIARTPKMQSFIYIFIAPPPMHASVCVLCAHFGKGVIQRQCLWITALPFRFSVSVHLINSLTHCFVIDLFVVDSHSQPLYSSSCAKNAYTMMQFSRLFYFVIFICPFCFPTLLLNGNNDDDATRAKKNTFILFIRSISVHYRMCAVIWPFVHWHRYLQIALCTISVPIQCLFCSLSFFWSCVCVFYICSCNCHVSTLRQYQQLSLSLSTVISICSSFAQIVLRKFNLSSKQIYIGF